MRSTVPVITFALLLGSPEIDWILAFYVEIKKQHVQGEYQRARQQREDEGVQYCFEFEKVYPKNVFMVT